MNFLGGEMKRLLNLIIFIGLWLATIILIATYSGGMPTDVIETSLLVIISLFPPLVLVGLVMLISGLFRKN